MTWLLEGLIALLLLLGALVALLGSWGLARLPDFFMRLHGPTKASTLGVGATLMGSLIYFSSTQPGVSVQEALITLFLFVTAPISAHLLARVALHRGLGAAAGRPAGQQDATPDKCTKEVIRSEK